MKCRQSSDAPLRTIKALVNAANIMVMANSTTQMPVEDAWRRVVLHHTQIAVRRNQVPPAAVPGMPWIRQARAVDLRRFMNRSCHNVQSLLQLPEFC